MKQHVTAPPADENHAPNNAVQQTFIYPIMPMYIPYDSNPASRQLSYPMPIFPNTPPYPLIPNRRHQDAGLSCNTFYPYYYPTVNNILPSHAHMSHPAPLISVHPRATSAALPLMPKQEHQRLSENSQNMLDNTERNKNLNIRECNSPIMKTSTREEASLPIINDNENNFDRGINKYSSSTSSSNISYSQTESASNLGSRTTFIPPSTSLQFSEVVAGSNDSNDSSDDFLTFIEQKTKKSIKLPELNPFANEFSFAKKKTATNDSPNINNTNEQIVKNESQSHYTVLFDNLIQKSLESIEAIKKSAKKVSVVDASVQSVELDNTMDRSAQTIEQSIDKDFIGKYSSRAIKLMKELLNHFQNVYQHDLHQEYVDMANTCDQLNHLILFLHHLILSQSEKNSTNDFNNPFSDMIERLTNDIMCMNRYKTSNELFQGVGRGRNRLMASTSNRLLPSFSCRQIRPTKNVQNELCTFCQEPLGENNDTMHKLCHALPIHTDISSST